MAYRTQNFNTIQIANRSKPLQDTDSDLSRSVEIAPENAY